MSGLYENQVTFLMAAAQQARIHQLDLFYGLPCTRRPSYILWTVGFYLAAGLSEITCFGQALITFQSVIVTENLGLEVSGIYCLLWGNNWHQLLESWHCLCLQNGLENATDVGKKSHINNRLFTLLFGFFLALQSALFLLQRSSKKRTI